LAVDPTKPHLILVGLPGSGKSTVGAAVAERLGRTFLDLDLEIERRESASVTQIFAEHGERYFRKRERELTDELRLTGNMIVAPGGGWVMDAESVALVRPPGRLVYLQTSPQTALRRLGAGQASRPLLSQPDPLAELKRILAERKAAYESADYVVHTELYNLQGVIEKVADLASTIE